MKANSARPSSGIQTLKLKSLWGHLLTSDPHPAFGHPLPKGEGRKGKGGIVTTLTGPASVVAQGLALPGFVLAAMSLLPVLAFGQGSDKVVKAQGFASV